MRTFYLDNFRGFTDTVIPVTQVSFCVGENSTGKTSFLALVSILSNPRFWFEQLFHAQGPGFSSFRDIVSIEAKDDSFFRIGFSERFSSKPSKSNGESASELGQAALFTFTKQEGAPLLSKCSYFSNGHLVHTTFTQKTVRYLAHELTTTQSRMALEGRLFQEWAGIHNDSTTRGQKVIRPKETDFESIPKLYFISHALMEAFPPKGKNRSRRPMLGIPAPTFGDEVAWIAPIRSKPKRTYDEVVRDFSPEGEHVPYLIRKLLNSRKEARAFKRYLKFVGDQTGLFEEVRIHDFGQTSGTPFEIEILLNKKALNISNVGYGVSQGLPVFVEVFARPAETLFAIQQPEVHLHPRAQAAFGETIFELARTQGKGFIVETHSDFTIDRFRIASRRSSERVEAQILFFHRKEGRNNVEVIPIGGDGRLPADQPREYRDFFLKEKMSLLGE